jgi:hypothetical protein
MVWGIAFLLIGAEVAVADELTINTVSVSIDSPIIAPPQRVAKRMGLSVATIGEQMLLGRAVGEVSANKLVYEKLIQEVFDRVLVGYSVQQVNINAGPDTKIEVVIVPWGDVVRDVTLEIDYGTISPNMIPFVKQDMGDLQARIKEVLVGMPVDSVEWAGGVAKNLIREQLASQLPEFHANIEIVAGSVAVVKLSLLPAGAVVQDVKVTLKSESIPNVLLLEARPMVEEKLADLQGLPVDFIERHRTYFTQRILAEMNSYALVRNFGLILQTAIQVGNETNVQINVESAKYKVTLDGYLDMGREGNSTNNAFIRLHVGDFIDPKDELFLETNFFPGTVTWQVAPGWGHVYGKSEVGIKYETYEKQPLFFFNEDIGHNWACRLERTPGTNYTEFGISYKVHDYLTLEYVISSQAHWLRVMANL